MARAFAEVLRRWCLSGSAAVIQQPTLCLPTLPHGNGARTIDLARCQKAMPPRGTPQLRWPPKQAGWGEE